MIPSEQDVNWAVVELNAIGDVETGPTKAICRGLAIIIRLLVAIYSKPDAND